MTSKLKKLNLTKLTFFEMSWANPSWIDLDSDIYSDLKDKNNLDLIFVAFAFIFIGCHIFFTKTLEHCGH